MMLEGRVVPPAARSRKKLDAFFNCAGARPGLGKATTVNTTPQHQARKAGDDASAKKLTGHCLILSDAYPRDFFSQFEFDSSILRRVQGPLEVRWERRRCKKPVLVREARSHSWFHSPRADGTQGSRSGQLQLKVSL